MQASPADRQSAVVGLVAGVVTSFFTFAGPYDNGGNGKHSEIDIEFVGKNTTYVQFNYWTNDDAYASNNVIPNGDGTDFADGAHNFGFRWTATRIEWYIDGSRATWVDESVSVNLPQATDSLQKFMMKVWPVDATASG